MTAINPARLKMQTAELGEIIDQADQFASRLHELLTYYSARIRQTSLSKTPLKLQAYQVPEPVIQALESEITERLEADPEAGYPLADTLWIEYWVEFRQLAIYILGHLPIDKPDLILSRIQAWLDQCTSEDIRRSIMTEGMIRLANERPEVCFGLIENLVSSGKKSHHQAALFGLSLFANDYTYTNLPVVFKHLSKILAKEEDGLTKEINALLQILAKRSEQETTYFLVKQLHTAYEPRILRLSRQLMNNLSQDNQALLREKMSH